MMYLRWILQSLLNLLGFLTAPIMFPVAYALRRIRLVREKLLWIYFDDEDGFGYEVTWWGGYKKFNFWWAYKWCALRNPAWNLHTLFMIDRKDSYSVVKEDGKLTKNGKVLKWNIWHSANLRYEDKNGEYMDNKGEYLSMKHSTLGKQFVIFKKESTNKLFWRFSYAGNVYKSFWVELQIGYSNRPTFRLKIKNIKKISSI